jgi:HlyD family secretion protein
MKLTRRTGIWAVAALCAVALVGVALRPRAVEVETGSVARGALRVAVAEEGETRLSRRFLVSAPVPGRVERIEMRPGDPVTAGETVIATIRPGDPVPLDVRTRTGLEARVKGADAAVARAGAERDRARVEQERLESELSRQRELAAAGLVPKDALENVEAQARGSQEAVRAAEAALRAAEFDLLQARAALLSGREVNGAGRSVVVRSPITGVVLKRLLESESPVTSGAPLVEVGDLRDLEIVSDLLSTDAVRVSAGAPVSIERWGGDHTLEGTVRRVEPSGFMKISALGVEEQRVNVVIDFVEGPERRPSLGDGFRVEIRIVVAEAGDVVKVPVSALFRSGDRWAVFAVIGERAVRREVELGLRNETEAEVRSGLEEGTRVVLYPGEALNDGDLVRDVG